MTVRKWCVVLIISAGVTFSARAQQFEIEQLLLNVEKLAQFKQILQDMKDGYEILVQGYGVIKNISEGNFNLHQTFLDGLLAVSPTVQQYKRIAETIQLQIALTKLTREAAMQFKASELMNGGDMQYVEAVYDRLFKTSLRNIEDLTMVITAGQLRMSDDERLQAIDRIYFDVQDQLGFARSFTEDNEILLLQKSMESKNNNVLRRLLDNGRE